MRRTLAAIDRYVDRAGLDRELDAAEPVRAVRPPVGPAHVDLRAEGITSVLWATGHRRSYPWLRVPVLDAAGEIIQRRGVTPVPGLYVLGQRFQHFRSSSFVHGVGRDAADVAGHLTSRVAVGAHR